MTQKAQAIGSITLTTEYGYDTAGRLSTITLPSGKEITYGYDDHLAVSVSVDTTTILNAATYDLFGPANGWTWGNSTSHSRSFSTRGLISSQSMVADTRTLTYDNAGRMISLDDNRHDLGFDYNALGELTDFTAAGSASLDSQDFTYDENGNRESLVQNSTTYTYGITTNTNRLASTTGPTARTYAYDAAGNVTSDNVHSYSYDDRGRLTSVDSGAATYQHNGQGQRVEKDNGSITLFAYDEAGRLMGEYDQYGNTIQEHVWFDGAPVAVIVGSNTYYVHTDHLGTPRIVTNGNTAIWRWESNPFGETAAQEDPDGDTTDFIYNLRFAGQYFDDETGLHYNYYRTYDPATGRYLESDPIGLKGGLNTYGYVHQNPLSWIDPFGLDVTVCLYPGAAGYGHVGYGVNSPSTFGFYPSDSDDGNPITGIEGIVKQDEKEPTSCKIIETTPEQDEELLAFLEGSKTAPFPEYTLTRNNCVNFVRQGLSLIGISSTSTIKPKPFYERLRGNEIEGDQ